MIYQFHPEAEGEHLETIAYYKTQRAGLGESFLTEFEAILELVVSRQLGIRYSETRMSAV